MKRIIVSSKHKRYALVSDESLEIVALYRWHTTGLKGSYYASTKIDGKTVLMHRLLMNPPRGMVVDHINHDRLDNRLENLRVVTQRENVKNHIEIIKSNTSGHRGVSWHRDGWMAYGNKNGQQKYIGKYKTKEEAAAKARRWYRLHSDVIDLTPVKLVKDNV